MEPSVKNKDKGITVRFSSVGRNHVLYARSAGFEKLAAIFALTDMVENAKFTNFKNPDPRDSLQVLGFMNFKCAVAVNGRQLHFRVVVRVATSGNFFYDLSVKVIKK
jgi:hypothetical protein